MHITVWVCIWTPVCLCFYMPTCMYIHIYIYVSSYNVTICICTCVSTLWCFCVCVCVCVCVCGCVYSCVSTFLHVGIHVCVGEIWFFLSGMLAPQLEAEACKKPCLCLCLGLWLPHSWCSSTPLSLSCPCLPSSWIIAPLRAWSKV